MSYNDITPAQLRKVADLKEKLLEIQSEIDSILGGSRQIAIQPKLGRPSRKSTTIKATPAKEAPLAVKAESGRGRKKKRTMSPEGRAKIAEAQKARWAKVNAKK